MLIRVVELAYVVLETFKGFDYWGKTQIDKFSVW